MKTSPVPKKKHDPIALSFSEALKTLLNGSKITKAEWNNPEIYGVLKDEKLTLHKDDGKFYLWIVSQADILGEDWLEIPQVN